VAYMARDAMFGHS